jgi:hypothetical protein
MNIFRKGLILIIICFFVVPGIYTIITAEQNQIQNNKILVPDLICQGTLSWSDVTPGETIEGNIIVANIGDPGSGLDWEITDYPEWGEWDFNPKQVFYQTPGAGDITVHVTLIAPQKMNKKDFSESCSDVISGHIKIENIQDSDDSCQIPVTVMLLKTKIKIPWIIFFYTILKSLPILI